MRPASKETILSAFRHLLTAGGAVAVTRGYVSADQLVQVVGALTALVGALWGPLDEFLAARRVEDEARIAAQVKAAVEAALAARSVDALRNPPPPAV